jgi:hypothetical protein
MSFFLCPIIKIVINGLYIQEKRPAVELLWRISRACHLMGSIQPTKKKDYVFEGELENFTLNSDVFVFINVYAASLVLKKLKARQKI